MMIFSGFKDEDGNDDYEKKIVFSFLFWNQSLI